MSAFWQTVFLGSDEWGNDTMRVVADETAAECDGLCVVEVYEHAGWCLSFAYGFDGVADGTICDSANDACTTLGPIQMKIRVQSGNDFIRPPAIRRDERVLNV